MIGGGYKELRALHRGEESTVLLVENHAGEFAVVKRLLRSSAADLEVVHRFQNEATITALLRHPGFVGMLERREDRQGLPVMVLEYVDGVSLAAVMVRCRVTARPIPPALACHVVSMLCQTLQRAHSLRGPRGEPLRLLHRGVSPDNIMLSGAGEVKLLDFGHARITDLLEQPGHLAGVFGYMSPEQVRGLPQDARTDVFSAGTVLWEMLTLQRLFGDETDFAILDRIRQCHVPAPGSLTSSVPPELDRVVLAALARDPERRHGSAREFGEALDQFIDGAGPPSSGADLAAWLRQMSLWPGSPRTR